MGNNTEFDSPPHGNYTSYKKEKGNLPGHTKTVPSVLEEIKSQVVNTNLNPHQIYIKGRYTRLSH